MTIEIKFCSREGIINGTVDALEKYLGSVGSRAFMRSNAQLKALIRGLQLSCRFDE